MASILPEAGHSARCRELLHSGSFYGRVAPYVCNFQQLTRQLDRLTTARPWHGT